ncbi:MAG: ABC transporter ATP-binding protein [Acidobacteria bacterium]|nr:ABC transporter ATP-binding protein [Acidobacteriota bacterium]
MPVTGAPPPGSCLLEVEGLGVQFQTPSGIVRAVDGVGFCVYSGRTLAIVGESGSGKTVTVLSLLGLIPRPSGRIVGGRALFREADLLTLRSEEIRSIRGREIAMIFQDPLTALNPVQKVGSQIIEMIRAHERVSRRAARARAIELLRLVGIPSPEQRVYGYPHEFSGGMRQRVMIAMALSLQPSILIADEPSTALDVTVQAQILELLARLQDEFGMGMILITHDLGVVARVAHEILVMYAGRMVERGSPDELFFAPRHPYTWGLLGSVPRLDRRSGERLVSIPGMPPSLLHVPPGCPFHPRCGFRFEGCDRERPDLEWRGEHEDACFLTLEQKEAGERQVLGARGR